MEQHIGHYSYYANLRRFVDPAGSVTANWVPITYFEENGLLNRLPLPNGLRGTLTGRKQVVNGLQSPCDIAVFNTQVPAALALPLLRKRAYILCTDITPIQYDRMGKHYNHPPERIPLWAGIKHHLNGRMFRQAAQLLPWSSWTAESLVQDYGVDRAKIEVLPPGVDTTLWQPSEDDHRAAQVPLRILFVGGDFYRKGGEILLAAFRMLPVDSAELHIVTRSEIEPEQNVFVYHGMLPNSAELIHLYQQCDLFCLPTFAEAFGIVAIEASAAGLPVVATNIGGLTDVVVEGVSGHLVEAGDVGQLAATLGKLAAEPERCVTMGRAARQRAESCFDARKNSARMVQILENVWESVNREH
jgi:glycosyltransferase involved in cell wall biosynthesis